MGPRWVALVIVLVLLAFLIIVIVDIIQTQPGPPEDMVHIGSKTLSWK